MKIILNIFVILFGTIAVGMEDRSTVNVSEQGTYSTTEEKLQLWDTEGLSYANSNYYHSTYEGSNLFDCERFYDEFQDPLTKLFDEYLKRETEIQSEYPRRVFPIPLEPAFLNSRSLLYSALKVDRFESLVIIDDENTNFRDNVSIKYIDQIKGHGAFAARDFVPGEIIGEYVGVVSYLASPDHIEKIGSVGLFYGNAEELIFPRKSDDSYLFRLVGQHPYFLEHLEEYAGQEKFPLVIDAQSFRNEMGFVNHSRFPNAEPIAAIKMTVEKDKMGKTVAKKLEFAVFLVARTAISNGTEILYDYKYDSTLVTKKGLLDLRLENACYHCNNLLQQQNRKRCSKCKTAIYCDRNCQKDDWKNHTIYCHAVKNPSPRRND